MMLSVLRLN